MAVGQAAPDSAGVSRALLDAERSTHGVLGGAPEVIIIGQRG